MTTRRSGSQHGSRRWGSGVAGVVVLVAAAAGCDTSARLERAGASGPILGQPLPAFSLRDLGEQPYSLDGLAGRVVVLNLWATWCVPCLVEMPELQRLQTAYAPSDLTVLGISVDVGDGADIVRFLETNGIEYPNVRGDMLALVEALDLNRGIPHTILVDRAGIVRAYWRGRFSPDEPATAAMLRGIVDEIVDEPAKPDGPAGG